MDANAPIPAAADISLRRSLVLFRDRMVTNCLLFFCRADLPEELRREKYSTKLREKNQAPILPLTNGAKAGSIVPSFEYFAWIRTSSGFRCAKRAAGRWKAAAEVLRISPWSIRLNGISQ